MRVVLKALPSKKFIIIFNIIYWRAVKKFRPREELKLRKKV